MNGVYPYEFPSLQKRGEPGVEDLNRIKDLFVNLSDEQLIRQNARQLYAGSILLLQKMQENLHLVETTPRDIGALFKSIADATKAANEMRALPFKLLCQLCQYK